MVANLRFSFVPSVQAARRRGKSRSSRTRRERVLVDGNAWSHDQQSRITAFNEHRLEKLLSDDLESIFGHALPKIQRVQSRLRQRNLEYYSPKLLSIGPIHRYDDLPQGKKYKSKWAAMYLKGKSREIARQLFQKIVVDLPILKGFYSKDTINFQTDEDLAWIFFLDGCAVLYFMEKSGPESLQELMIKADQLMIVQQDMLLLENQLPFQVLELLSYPNEPGKLFTDINKFFTTFGLIPNGVQGKENNTTGNPDSTKCEEVPRANQPAHLLHLLRGKYTHEGKENNTTGSSNLTTHEEIQITVDHQPTDLLHLLCNKYKIKKNFPDETTQVERRGVKSLYTHRNIQELKASGIQVKKNKSNAMRTHINFETSLCFRGRLYLSEFFVDGSTAPTLLNMIALEMCPDFENNYEISSYVAFLDSLIDNVDDVKELRKAGVLFNMLGSDEAVATLFNTISTDLVPDGEIYQDVREKMELHYKSKSKNWRAQACYNYFNNPWSFLALLAALTALILTFIQTWFAIYPSHNA